MIKRTKRTILDFLPALQSPNFRLFVYGQSISLIGTWLASVAEQWLIYPVLTNNKSLIGVVSALNLLPTAALVLFGGVIADRIDKRKASIFIQSVFAIISFMLGILVYTHSIQIWHVMLAAFISGTFFSLDMPTRNTLMLELVDKEHFPSALSLNAGMFNTARAIGPAIAGFLIAWTGIASAYILNAISFIAVIVSLYYLKLPPHENKHEGVPFMQNLREGIAFIKNDPMMVTLLTLMALISAIAAPINTLFPIFAHDIFKTGEFGFGLLQSAFGVGAMIAAFSFAKLFEHTQNKKRLLLLGIAVSATSMFSFATTTSFIFALFSLILAGFSGGILFGLISSMIQLETPAPLRGRVMSIYSFVLFGFMPIGSLLLGVALKYVSAPLTVVASSVLIIITSFTVILSQKNFLVK